MTAHTPALRRLIVTADDFGQAIPINEAVEAAHRDGILTTASLMVTAPACDDAVERARRLPTLKVGLHLNLVQGIPALPPEQIPALVGSDGHFLNDPVKTGFRIFCNASARCQAYAETRAQFERFKATGLDLDHVDGHHHFHQHPSLVGHLIQLAPEFGIKAIRLPIEPPGPSCRAQENRHSTRYLGWIFSAARLLWMRTRLRKAGIACNDHIFGLHESGMMTPDRVAAFINHLPPGVSEIYAHPATRSCPQPNGLPEHYLCVEEFQALASRNLRELLETIGVEIISFSDLQIPDTV